MKNFRQHDLTLNHEGIRVYFELDQFDRRTDYKLINDNPFFYL